MTGAQTLPIFMPSPSWEFLAQFTPTGLDWAYTEPTDAAWFRLEHGGEFAYPDRAVGLIADAEFSDGKVNRGEARLLYHSTDRQLLFIPVPIIFAPGQRRIAIRRLARTPSYTPWQLSIYQSNLMPIYNDTVQPQKEQAYLDSVPTTFTAPTYAQSNASTVYQALAANANRRKFSVTNTGSAPVYLDLDPPGSLTGRSYTIGAGSTFLSDFEWQQPVYIWSSNALPQVCQIRELI